MIDIIYEIALHTDYNITLILLDLYPKIKRGNFWDIKWQKMYPDRKYFAFWDRETNYLIQHHQKFDLVAALGICQQTIYLSSIDYKYKKYEDQPREYHYDHYFVAIPSLDDQFIISRDDPDNIVSVIGQFPTLALAVQHMEKDFVNHTKPGLYGKRRCDYNILDISEMKICFEIKPDIILRGGNDGGWNNFYCLPILS